CQELRIAYCELRIEVGRCRESAIRNSKSAMLKAWSGKYALELLADHVPGHGPGDPLGLVDRLQAAQGAQLAECGDRRRRLRGPGVVLRVSRHHHRVSRSCRRLRGADHP